MFFKSKYQKKKKKKTGTYFATITLLSEENDNYSFVFHFMLFDILGKTIFILEFANT